MFAYLDLCMGNLFSYFLPKFNLRKRKIKIERICKPIICQDLVSLTSGKKFLVIYLQANHMAICLDLVSVHLFAKYLSNNSKCEPQHEISNNVAF